MRLIVMLAALSATQASIVGIDIGSEFMKIAVVKYSDGIGEIVTNVESKRKTQVVVGFNEGERVYAGGAMNLIARYPENAHTGLRLLLGRELTHPRVKALIDDQWYPVQLEVNDKGRIQAIMGDAKYTTEELLAMVMQYGKAITKAYAPKFVKSVRECVLTVPSFYTQNERQALMDTAHIAGLKASLLDENTAAAIQYAVDRTFNKTRTVLFYNLGANSLQVSIASFSSRKPKGEKKKVEKFTIKAKAFDETVGGKYFDNKLMNFMADKFNEGRPGKPDVRSEKKVMARMVAIAMKQKKTLSASKKARIKMEQLHDGSDLLAPIERDQFEELCSDLFAKLTPKIDEVLAQAKLTKEKIDSVELLGGGYRVPKITEKLQEYFGADRELGTHMNSDETFVMGAAFHAANSTGRSKCKPIGMNDIYPFAISIALSGRDKEIGVFKKGAKIGTRKIIKFSQEKDVTVTLKYGADRPEGTPEKISVWEVTGVNDFAGANPGAKVELQIFLDNNGIVKVTRAKAFVEKGKSEELKVELTNEGVKFKPLSSAEKKASTAVLAKFEEAEALKNAKLTARNSLEKYISKVKEQMSTEVDPEEEEFADDIDEETAIIQELTDDQKSEVKDQLEEVRDWLDDETGVGEASVYETKQNDLELKVMEVTKEIRARKAAEAAAKKAAEEAAEAAKAEKAAGEL